MVSKKLFYLYKLQSFDDNMSSRKLTFYRNFKELVEIGYLTIIGIQVIWWKLFKLARFLL